MLSYRSSTSRNSPLRRSSIPAAAAAAAAAADTDADTNAVERATSTSSTTFGAADDHHHHQEERRPRRRQLIVGGEVAPPDKYPFFVLLNDGNCGGSLIAPDIVLTAGHCKPFMTLRKARKRKDFDAVDWVRVGPYKRFPENDDDGADEEEEEEDHDDDDHYVGQYEEESFAVWDATRHVHYKRYGEDEFRYDYTIIKLNGTSIHPTLELYRQSLLDDVFKDNDVVDDDDDGLGDDDRNNPVPVPIQVTAMGMGDTNKHRPSRSNVLREVNLTVVPNSLCGQIQGEGMSYEGRIGRSHLCTFAPHKDSCNYDSGSPIVLFDNDDDDRPKLVGQVSWGEECADPIFPAVNSRISTVLDWIDEVVCDWSEQPPASFRCFPTVDDAIFPSGAATTTTNDGSGNNHNLHWMSHLPKPGDADFVWVILMSILAAGAGRYLWKLRRQDCDYTQLK